MGTRPPPFDRRFNSPPRINQEAHGTLWSEPGIDRSRGRRRSRGRGRDVNRQGDGFRDRNNGSVTRQVQRGDHTQTNEGSGRGGNGGRRGYFGSRGGRGGARGREGDSSRGRGNRGGYFRGQRGAQSLDSLVDITNRDQTPKRPDGNRRFGKPREHPMGYKALEALVKKPSDFVVLELLDEKSGFHLLLEEEDISADKYDLLVECLAIATQSQSNKESLLALFNKTEKNVIDRLASHALTIKRSYPEKAQKYCTNLYKFMSSFAVAMINISLNRLSNSVDIILAAISPLLVQGHITEALVKEYEDLQTKLSNAAKKWEQDQGSDGKRKGRPGFDLDDLEPPEDFRELTVLPTSFDITVHERPFLRKNVVQGRYRDGNHYLDVQFRLLREDFVQPLRYGINDFKAGSRKVRDVRVYKHVLINGPQMVRRQLFHTVTMTQARHLKLDNSKRLLFGNLLCLSKDNFKTMILASVFDRDPEKLKKDGTLGVKFESDLEHHDLSGEFTMVESRAYFMAYKHVLKALQEIPNDSLPLQDYIVQVEPIIQLPEYVTPGVGYDLRVIKNPKMMKQSEAHNLLLRRARPQVVDEPIEGEYGPLRNVRFGLDLMYWPSSAELNLDDSQRRALRSALTRELAIIQGPPGTGKTFLGLKIVQALLHNSSMWKDADNPTPILVVCFTNHALDQFLEGMTEFTSSIVRVGSRTKSETIEKFQINNLVRSTGRALPHNIYVRNAQVRDDREGIANDISRLRTIYEVCDSNHGIIDLSVFLAEGVMTKHIQKQLGNQKLVDWLLYNNPPQDAFSYGNQMQSTLTNSPKQSSKQSSTSPEVEIGQDKLAENDIEELLQLEERDRILEVDLDESIPCKSNFNLEYELRDDNLACEMNHIMKLYNQGKCKNEDFTRYSSIQGLRDTMAMGFQVPKRTREMSKMEKWEHLNIWNLDFESRWQMYKFWLRKLQDRVGKTLQGLEARFKTATRALDEIRDQKYLYMMRHHSIVGMTTTGAAQYNRVLQDLAPAIVVIEEAAEILESHVVTSLSAKCKHLIMIGDHQQLRPSATVYELAIKYGLETSLFERMIKNGLPYEILEYQHRMRPNISKLLVPSVYAELKDHPSVHQYPKISGITKDVFFITHQVHEREESDDNNSHENLHEAELVIGLCRHLMLQGYSPEDVTILTAYSGQFFLLRKLQRLQKECTGVRICVVDNFQGEENKIILLSLVRSNPAGVVGFLKTENRVCVALSRARHGLYITGNMNLLSTKSELWRKIREDLLVDDAVGDSLTLQCENHPEQLTSVSTGQEFIRKSPEGGCRQVCDKPLPKCKHSCPRICHMDDRKHSKYECQVPCPKILCMREHPCPKKCWEECGPCMELVEKSLPCDHIHRVPCHVPRRKFNCPTIVEKVIPHCEHKVNLPCHKDPAEYRCPMDCDTRLDCGHKCRLVCHRTKDPDHLEYSCYEACTKLNQGCVEDHPCVKKCYEECGACAVIVTKTLPCRHTATKVECSEPVEKIECKQKCRRTLPCGHPCKKLCYKPCGDCPVGVKKTVPDCLHEILVECSQPATTDKCGGRCPKKLACGHPCTQLCKEKCTAYCMQKVTSPKQCPKGHYVKLPCHLLNKLTGEEVWPYCDEPCNSKLECDHPCVGNCGRCFQGRLHVPCRPDRPCSRSLVCGHICKQPCSADCPPCQENCQWKCNHSQCRKRCGMPCEPCKEPCSWKCAPGCPNKLKCNNRCGEKCSRKSCDQPCEKKLPCGHPCVGFCGDPCPPLCRLCHKEELTSFMLMGNEDEEDARFVYLEDCRHTIEAEGLEGWMMTMNEEIGMKKCPRCSSTIYNNRRYQNIVLDTYQCVKDVKAKYDSHSKVKSAKKRDIELILQNPKFTTYYADYAKKLMETLGIGIFKKHKNKYFISGELQLYFFQAQILDKATSILQSFEDEDGAINAGVGYVHPGTVRQVSEREALLRTKLTSVLERIMGRTVIVAPQMMKELSCELQRLAILPAYWKFQEKFKTYQSNNDDLQKIKTVLELLMDPTVRFDETLDKRVRENLKASEPYFGGLGISEKERVMIVEAMGMAQGHWYKCPNGHVYCITECGGAVMESTCPNCGATIGGGGHALRQDNAVASEMDGARHPAFSQHYNMNNFNFNDIV